MRAAQRLLAGCVVAAAAAALAASARAAPGMFFGFTEDAPKQYGAEPFNVGSQLGAKAFRLTLGWNLGQTALAPTDVPLFDRAMAAAAGMRVVLAVYGTSAAQTPVTDTDRAQFCNYVRDTIARYPAINDVIIWNEPNKSFFWQPQFNADGTSAAPAAYEALLARCYDVLHAFRPAINVVAPALSSRGNDDPSAASNVSHSPGAFIRKLGDAYRASGRTGRILDTVSAHAYGETSSERPWKQHQLSKTIAEGDWNKLMYNLWQAFNGTGQPIPGQCGTGTCVSIWYTETGFQTQIDAAKAGLYTGTENEPAPVPDFAGGEPASPPPSADSNAPDQATQIVDATRLAYCQPYVGAYFNFLLWDEASLVGWQSAPFWADHTPKDSYSAFSQATGDVNAGTIDCTSLKGGQPSSDFMPPTAPTGITATATGSSTVAVSWSASTDDVGVTAYRVYRNGGQVATVSTTSWTDTGRAPSTTYSYTVRALDAAGNVSDASAAASATTPAQDYRSAVLGSGPIAYLRLGESSGATAADASGNGHPGVYSGGVTFGAAGALSADSNTAASFDGQSGAVSLSGLPVSTAAGGKNTVEFWMYWDGSPTRMPFGFQAYDLIAAWGVFGFNTGQGDVYGVLSSGLANRWVHVVAVFTNGDVSQNKLYIDGVQQAISAHGTPASRTATSSAVIGSWTYGGYNFSGRLDEVAVYNRELSPTEVTADYNSR